MLLVNPYYQANATAGPLSLAYLGSSLKMHGFNTAIIDCKVTGNYLFKITRALREFDTVGITVNIGTVSSAIAIAKYIRKISPATRIIMGGIHATAIYQDFLPHYADIVVLGEGEKVIVELARKKELNNIKGIAYWDNGLRVNPQREPLGNLDELPHPAWDLFELNKYMLSPDTHTPTVNMVTSRGCPFNCIYCSTKLIYNQKINLRSIENLLGELDYLTKTLRIKEVWIVDDNFTLYPQRVREFCQAVIDRQYRLRFILFNSRADFCDFDTLKLMAQAGFIRVFISVESASQDILNKLNKKLDITKVKTMVQMLNSLKIECGAFFMWGLPYDNLSTMQKTINFAKNLHVTQLLFFQAIPLPGTPLYTLVKKEGNLIQDARLRSIEYIGQTGGLYEIYDLKVSDIRRIAPRIGLLNFSMRFRFLCKKLFSKDGFRVIKNYLKIISRNIK